MGPDFPCKALDLPCTDINDQITLNGGSIGFYIHDR